MNVPDYISPLVGYRVWQWCATGLWHTESGYDAIGLARDWYARRGEERRIKPGDRVAVLGRGIAVVEMAGDNQVHAVLWSRDMVRIERREIHWDEGNMRWETAVVAGKSEHRGG